MTKPGTLPKKSQPKGGSRKGIPNKVTRELKEMILQALDNAGGVEYLTSKAEEHPTAFLTLIGKVLPLQVTGEGGGPVTVEILRFGLEQKTPDASALGGLDAPAVVFGSNIHYGVQK